MSEKIVQLYPNPEIGELKLKKTVFLAYTDIAAAGSRALLGISMCKEYHMLDIPEIAECKAACVRDVPPEPSEQDFQPVQILQCKYEQTEEEFSLVIVNTVVPGESCHHVAANILDLCHESRVEKLILLSALHLDLPNSQLQDMYENTFNVQSVTQCPSLPGDTRICDPFLSTVIQMIQVDRFPCSCLIVPGHKASFGRPNKMDGSEQNIVKFQKVIERLTKLQFDTELSLSLAYKGLNTPDTDMVSQMYM